MTKKNQLKIFFVNGVRGGMISVPLVHKIYNGIRVADIILDMFMMAKGQKFGVLKCLDMIFGERY